MKIFKKRGEMTHFQLMTEIAKDEPNIRQKDLAERLNITIQAVSENMKQLKDLGYIESEDGRSPYKITPKGLDKLKKDAISLRKYSDETLSLMSNYKSVWPAIAGENLVKGQTVGLYMENGLLYADEDTGREAIAQVMDDTEKGKDVALSQMKGLINIEPGQVLVITLPPIKEGGSRNTDLDLIKEIYAGNYSEWGMKTLDKVAVIGTISHVVTNSLNIPVDIEYASTPASIACSKKGLNVLLIVVDNMLKNVTKSFEHEDIKYNIIDASIN